MTEQEQIKQLEQRVKALEETVATIREDTLNDVKSWWQSELQNSMCHPSD